MDFVDIHTHILTGVDDGAKSEEIMRSMLDLACKNGTRKICCTPHYHPGYYGDNFQKAYDAYLRLCDYAAEKHPEMQLFLGNELYYDQGCVDWIDSTHCRTLNGTRYVLIEFNENEDFYEIETALMSLLNHGYIPVLAHIERYSNLRNRVESIAELHDNGVVIQVNAHTLVKAFKNRTVSRLMHMRIVDIIASDTHNLGTRPPILTPAYNYVCEKFSESYAERLFVKNPEKILSAHDNKK